jgi:hypothetical protein
MKAVLIMNAKLSSCVANDRGDMLEDMVNVKENRGQYPVERIEFVWFSG